MNALESIEAIKSAVESGRTVYADTRAYEVRRDPIGQWLIVCTLNNYCIGLTWRDGKTLNGRQFFTD